MANEDWRIRIELEPERTGGFLERLGLDLSSRAKDLAEELKQDRLAVTRDDETIFVYASSGTQAENARRVVEAELEEADITPHLVRIEHWLEDEERWDDEPETPSWEEDAVARGYAPWEVRVTCASHDEARELADRLEQEGRQVVRRWSHVIVGAESEDEAEELARRLHGEIEPGGEVVWEVMPPNPFAVFGGFAG